MNRKYGQSFLFCLDCVSQKREREMDALWGVPVVVSASLDVVCDSRDARFIKEFAHAAPGMSLSSSCVLLCSFHRVCVCVQGASVR